MKKVALFLVAMMFVLIGMLSQFPARDADAVSLTLTNLTTGQSIYYSTWNTYFDSVETAVSQLNTAINAKIAASRLVNYSTNDIARFKTYTASDNAQFNNWTSGNHGRIVAIETSSSSLPTRFVNHSTAINSRVNTKLASSVFTGYTAQYSIGSKLNASVFTAYSGTKAHATLKNVYAASTGTPDNTYEITLTPAPASYYTGMIVGFKSDYENTGASTLNVNSLGAKALRKDYNAALAAADILANQTVLCMYDGTNFQVLSASVADGTGSGETNTASNVGTQGVGIYKQKVGAEFQFRTLTSVDGSISITVNAGNNTLEFSSMASAGTPAQIVFDNDTAYRSLTDTIPADNTIPLVTEGTEILSASITPKAANSVLMVSCHVNINSNTASTYIISSAYINNTCIGTSMQEVTDANAYHPFNFTAYRAAQGTNAKTVTVRIGPADVSANTIYLNGNSAGRKFGGTYYHTLRVEEVRQ